MASGAVSYHIANLLDKMTSSDKDFRFMAINDLMAELEKDSIKLDDCTEQKVVKMLLLLLEDKNGEVQNLTVKCLGPLVKKVKEYQVETIVDSLCVNMISGKEQLRDISSIGLKTVISKLPSDSSALAGNVCKRITGRLSGVIERQEDVSVQLEALDILCDLLSRFGGLLLTFHAQILDALLPQLSSPRQAVRKRSIVGLSLLGMSCNSELYTKLVDSVLDGLTKNSSISSKRTYVQCLVSICRQSGHRFGGHIEQVMALIDQYSIEEDEELRESCLQVLEAFVRRCPKEITPHINKIVTLCLEYITYDPNYIYADDGLDKSDTMETDDDDEDEFYSDDDDMSWKVRRSAAKCLEAVMSTRPELLSEFYETVSPALIARFKEREENVKSDIFQAYTALLKQTHQAVGPGLDPDCMDQSDAPVHLLMNQVPMIVKAVQVQMREKSTKTRQNCFELLKELVLVLPGVLSNHIAILIPGIQFSLGDKNSSSSIKIDTLVFINCLLSTHPPNVFYEHITVLLPLALTAVKDSFYKIISEALLVIQSIVKVIRPLNSQSNNFDFKPFVNDLYQCTLMPLKSASIDQEVKERAISCMGQIICNLGDYLAEELKTCLPIFVDRLRNEITRLATVKALTTVAASPLAINIGSILEDAVPILCTFLRKNMRPLKLNTLILFDTLVCKYGSCLSPSMVKKIMEELDPLINESDLHVAQLTMTLLTSISRTQPSAMTLIAPSILSEILTLAKSPLLQGAALESMYVFFQSLGKLGLPGLGFKELLAMLVLPITQANVTGAGNAPTILHKQAFHSLAKCVSALTKTRPEESLPVVNQFLRDVQSPQSDAKHIFALLVIGEIGRQIDLSGIANLKELILNSFSAPSEEVKSAASYTLGSVAVGNLTHFLPFVLAEIETQTKRQYLLLHSLKEVITCHSSTPEGIAQLLPFVPAIWQQLFQHCECVEEGTRSVVAECLGKLTLINPENLLPYLQRSLQSPSPLMRTTVVAAVKYTISDKPQAIDPLLSQCIGQFLNTLQDPDVNVRRVALVTFNSAAHNKPQLVRDLLDNILPQLYLETKVKEELIREVEMGPFRHKVDDGLDVRKAAFECMYTLLDTCLDRLDIFEYLNHVESGLKDHYDIQMLTYLMVARLAQLSPVAVVQRLDGLIEPLRNTCLSKVKANAVKQEFQKQDELKRSAIRAMAALLAISDADKNPLMCEFLSQIKASPDLKVFFDNIQRGSENVGDVLVMEVN